MALFRVRPSRVGHIIQNSRGYVVSGCRARGSYSVPSPSSLFRALHIRRITGDHQPERGDLFPYEGVHPQRTVEIAGHIRSAVRAHSPVVALESTIYTHGFPNPENFKLAMKLERLVRKFGALPATIGVINGVVKVGLTPAEIRLLCDSAGKPETMKVSRRDLAYIMGLGICGKKINGGTTVAATMMLAHHAGIKVFGTGGLGGVHRGGQDSMDISADLTELGRTPVAVISSGCKSFLDIPRTLEYLETQGVTVCTFAQSRKGDVDLPGFYTRESGVKSPLVVNDTEQAAAMIFSQQNLNIQSGMLLANPIPEGFALPKAEIDAAIDQAVAEAASRGFHGHANTPFILSRIKDLTQGRSIELNEALICSNVITATKVAKSLSELHLAQSLGETKATNENPNSNVIVFTEPQKKASDATSKPDIIVFGSVAVDLSCDLIVPESDPAASSISSPKLHTSNVAAITPSIGGVGHNVALAAQLVSDDLKVILYSKVGDDLAGKTILEALKSEGLDTSEIQVAKTGIDQSGQTTILRTAQYVSTNDTKKDLVLAMADMGIFHETPYSDIKDIPELAKTARWFVGDANWASSHIRNVLKGLKEANKEIKLAYEPVSVAKSAGIFLSHPAGKHSLKPFPNNSVDLTTPNHHELAAMHAAAKEKEYFEAQEWWEVIDALGIPSTGARDRFVRLTNAKMTDEGIPLQTIQLLPFIPIILTKLGAEGVLHTELLKPDDPRLTDPEDAAYILSRCANGSTQVGGVYMRLYPAVETVEDVVSVNGVGDTFLGVLIAGLARGAALNEDLINIAQKAAVMTLRSKEAVSPEIKDLAGELGALAQ
ncbi:Indigoidine synthase A like protein-domain-containing protein [Halenospora varia]|nr:Indigoidine synthase A like protein-domain-containing protein [Halenospora varia]